MKALVLIQGTLGERMTGPEIRGMEIARAFARRGDVTVAARVQQPSSRAGLPVVPGTRGRILSEALRHDAVIGPVIPPYVLALLARRRAVTVADLYDPVELEFGTLDRGAATRRDLRQRREIRRMQLRWADVVVCANDAQRERASADLRSVSRPAGPPTLVTAPMGLPDPPPPTGGRPLRDRFTSISADDPVVLWWGSVWRWLDAETAIQAVGLLAQEMPRIRLVVTAGRPPNAATDRLNATESARELARRLGLLDRHVFFLDEWVPFDERHGFLQDANVGVTLHADTAEAPLAARARYMDYLWASVPCVLARGDEVAERFGACGAAELVSPRDPAATARALASLLGEPHRAERARRACHELAAAYRWPALLRPLVQAAEAAAERSAQPHAVAGASAASAAGAYYAQRALDVSIRMISR